MEVQRWPAVPTEPKKTAGTARARSASGMTIAAGSDIECNEGDGDHDVGEGR